MENTQTPQQLDAWSLVMLGWRNKWLVMTAGLVAAAVAFGVCKSIEPLYESHAVMLPGSSNSRDKLLEEFRYGFEPDSERLIQMLSSESVLDSLEHLHNLCAKWGIDKSSKSWFDRFSDMSKERIVFHKTRQASVVVSVMDPDPEFAAKIANETCRLVNVVNANIVKHNAIEVLESVERELSASQSSVELIHDTIGAVVSANTDAAIQRLRHEISSSEFRISILRDSISRIRSRHNIFDYGYQVNVLNEQLADARAIFLQESGSLEVLRKGGRSNDTLTLRTEARMQGAQRRVEYFEQQLRDLSSVNRRYEAFLDAMELETEDLADSKTELSKLLQSIEPKVTSRGLSRLEMRLDFDQYRLNELRQKYQTALTNYYNPVQIAHVISPARPSYKKVFPKTSISMVFAGLGAVLLSLAVLAVLDQFRRRSA